MSSTEPADPGVGLDELNLVTDSLDPRIALGGGPAVPGLITQPPDVGTGRTTVWQPVSRRNEDGASAAADVEQALVAPKAELVKQLPPHRQLPWSRAIPVAQSDSEHCGGAHLRQNGGEVPIPFPCPPAGCQETDFDEGEAGNADVPTVDAVAGSITRHVAECVGDGAGRPRGAFPGYRTTHLHSPLLE